MGNPAEETYRYPNQNPLQILGNSLPKVNAETISFATLSQIIAYLHLSKT